MKHLISTLTLICVALATFAFPITAFAQQNSSQTAKWQRILKDTELEQLTFVKDGATLKYCQHLYNKSEKGKPAILVFLHGIGERGDNNLAQNELGVPDIVKNIREQKHKVVLITCQCPSTELWAPLHRGGSGAALQPQPSKTTGLIPALIESKIKEFNADADRVYITGLSMGGYGTWDIISRRPDLFAAAIPICGGADPVQAPVLKDMAISIFHGERDNLVPTDLSREMYRALVNAGNRNVKITIYPGVEHNSWEKAYADPETFKWLFAQKRTKKATPPYSTIDNTPVETVENDSMSAEAREIDIVIDKLNKTEVDLDIEDEDDLENLSKKEAMAFLLSCATLIKRIDTSRCPLDFRIAYEHYVQAVEYGYTVWTGAPEGFFEKLFGGSEFRKEARDVLERLQKATGEINESAARHGAKNRVE